MSERVLGIPMIGKMMFRTFHGRHFISCLKEKNIVPIYFSDEKNISSGGIDGTKYVEFPAETDVGYLERAILRPFRRFVTPTATADLRFRDSLYQGLFGDHPVEPWMRYAILLNILRKQRYLAPLSVKLSKHLVRNSAYRDAILKHDVKTLLTGGIGSYGFDFANAMVYEAQKIGVKIVSAVSNYDNITNRGYRGYMPDKLAVWSQLMADEAIKYNGISADRVHVVGTVQFDRYCRPPDVGREEFLSARSLDPTKKTILYAGGTNTVNILYFFKLFTKMLNDNISGGCNLVIRPHPDPRLVYSPAVWAVEQLAKKCECNVYISNPLEFSSDSMSADDDLDELHCLLKFSDVLVNHYSTMGLEAAICDLPTIYINYEPCNHGFYYTSTSHWQSRMTHNMRELRLKAAKVSESDDKLLADIQDYLVDRSLDSDKRAEYAFSECGVLDGKAGLRLADVIYSV